jgi:hypothetical protein
MQTHIQVESSCDIARVFHLHLSYFDISHTQHRVMGESLINTYDPQRRYPSVGLDPKSTGYLSDKDRVPPLFPFPPKIKTYTPFPTDIPSAGSLYPADEETSEKSIMSHVIMDISHVNIQRVIRS